MLGANAMKLCDRLDHLAASHRMRGTVSIKEQWDGHTVEQINKQKKLKQEFFAFE